MKSRRFIIVTMVILLLSVGALGASEVKQVFYNDLGTSGVKIELRQEGENKLLCPGEHVNYVSLIRNCGEPCYVRLLTELELGKFDDPGDLWIKRGKYYYYRELLNSGEKINFAKGFKVGNELVPDGEIEAKVTVDAIQAENFIPKFESISPWGTIEIQDSSYNNKGFQRLATKKNIERLTYTRDGLFECSATDLFKDFGAISPGGKYKGKLPIGNKSDKNIRIYLMMETKSSKLLEKIKTTLWWKDKNIYEGNLLADKFSSKQLLGTLKPGEEASFDYEIRLGEDADNDYMELSDRVKWSFILENVDKETWPKTGDGAGDNLLVAISLCTASLILIVMVILKRKGI